MGGGSSSVPSKAQIKSMPEPKVVEPKSNSILQNPNTLQIETQVKQPLKKQINKQERDSIPKHEEQHIFDSQQKQATLKAQQSSRSPKSPQAPESPHVIQDDPTLSYFDKIKPHLPTTKKQTQQTPLDEEDLDGFDIEKFRTANSGKTCKDDMIFAQI
ncbi:hypothetical protein SS50377_22576 [Spironucleus salmonicida]|uniref:Uncharacterized protein n=1 Tax=Spironucleus salmonicida TaxID=348837 RepID=V6LBV4_9EUKA|nr:hypothetical protein SS50377_22576 [Spironucleus salmonicida]|eukprot:EST41932.1 Hypothetical protein SS50377_18236 [Spironucleus salmonicida]